MSIRLFFSPPEDNETGVAIAENALESGARDKPRHREQLTQRARRLHVLTLEIMKHVFMASRTPKNAVIIGQYAIG